MMERLEYAIVMVGISRADRRVGRQRGASSFLAKLPQRCIRAQLRTHLLPRKCIPRHEACQHIIAPNHTACARDKQRHRHRKHQETLFIHKFPLLGPMQQLLREPTHRKPI